MKNIFVLFLLFGLHPNSIFYGQEIDKKLDSLIEVWNNKNNEDTARFIAINDFIWTYRNIDADSCFHFIDLMFNEASLKNNDKFIARSWSLRGTLSRATNNEKNALLYYQKASCKRS